MISETFMLNIQVVKNVLKNFYVKKETRCCALYSDEENKNVPIKFCIGSNLTLPMKQICEQSA